MSIFYPHGMTAHDLDDDLDGLEDNPRGYCPWCGRLLHMFSNGLFTYHCRKWDATSTEDENRIRYAAERLSEMKVSEQIGRSRRQDLEP